MKIYTKGGDKGTTGIYGGERVPKDDPRIEANGTLDELCSSLGVIRSQVPVDHEFQKILQRLQVELMNLMAVVATPSKNRKQKRFDEAAVVYCEEQIDRMEEFCNKKGSDKGYFILPGGTPVSASCHMARCIARRAERRLWTLNREDVLPDEVLAFVNRLSDLLFTMARYELCDTGTVEEKWKSFIYEF